mgnify:FL=1
MPSETLAQARQAMDFILKHHLSKYNHAPELSDNHPLRSPSKSETVLIIDQTFGDMAIQYGGADASTFELMFQTALNENPQADIWVKTHPDVLCGKKQGYLTQLVQNTASIFWQKTSTRFLCCKTSIKFIALPRKWVLRRFYAANR